jgi:cobalamin biosynthesis Mg chelatase CobN
MIPLPSLSFTGGAGGDAKGQVTQGDISNSSGGGAGTGGSGNRGTVVNFAGEGASQTNSQGVNASPFSGITQWILAGLALVAVVWIGLRMRRR